jgi:pimeloyl-ACP methyl ester carboxylesterase
VAAVRLSRPHAPDSTWFGRTIAAVSPRRVLALAFVVAMLAAACNDDEARPVVRDDLVVPTESTVAPTEPPDVPPLPRPDPVTWQPCDGLECGTVRVPLDYDHPEGRQIDLALARTPVAEPDERIGSLVVNPGGPGGSGIDLVRRGALADLTDRFDVVSWDPRGVGRTERLACGGDAPGFLGLDPHPDTTDERRALETAAEEIAFACEREDPGLLENIDVTVTAHDLEQIRRAIGDEQLDFMGFSYGTAIGLEYARLYPTKLRTLTLDGVVDPTFTLEEMLTGQAVVMEGYLSGLTDLYDRVMARAESDPLSLGDGGEAGPDIVVLAAIASTYRPDGRQDLERALRAADQENATPLRALADEYIHASDAFGAYLAVMCTDGPRPTGVDGWRDLAARLASQAPRLGETAANELLACAFWPSGPGEQRRPVAPRGLAPALVIGTTGDAATPYDDAVRVAANLPGAALLTLDSEGHTAFGDPCVDGVVRRYLVELALPEPGSVCES